MNTQPDGGQSRLLNLSPGDLMRLGIAIAFTIGIMLYVKSQVIGVPNSMILIIASMVGGYMAMNIGANDVANNVGPAVGSKAITLTGAIVIAGIFEAAGALIAGGSVVSTIKKGIINPELISNPEVFVWLMLAALLAAAIWLNAATMFGAPVSTTHSIVGGVLGAGIAAGGLGIANWGTMGQIAASWVISPVLGGLIAAGFLYIIEHQIIHRKNKLEAAQKVIPLLVGVMAWAFSVYLILKGIKKIWKTDFLTASIVGLVIAVAVVYIARPLIKKASQSLTNSRDGVNEMFIIPLIFSAALLSFAHGANDVANAIGPLAAINDAILSGEVHSKAGIPLWVMVIGALGIAIGLALYGPKLIRTVGSEITELDKTRAYCIAMAASITVIIATQLGLPVSSTHIAVGGVFGVGFLREYFESNRAQMIDHIRDHHKDDTDHTLVEASLQEYEDTPLSEKGLFLKKLKQEAGKGESVLTKSERKQLKKAYRQELVQRSMVYKIAAAWIITVPASGLLAATLYFLIRGIMVPY
ncbi:inorganic phosphate transporter [Leucothrix pacifica]|uniref:Phosphate transporter n=1 Tax=Leucothrix pacifica TaxID=1247513 RepID=A0A317C0Q9_9GAMM|nr:inorganic phosphate transporter [Leucothrix pacifica]PWQ92138.1 inorganic phosphate transporter [Leucothrix pacifica]